MSTFTARVILIGAIGALVLYALGLWWGIPLVALVLWYQHRDMKQGSPAAHVKRAATGLADPREASRE